MAEEVDVPDSQTERLALAEPTTGGNDPEGPVSLGERADHRFDLLDRTDYTDDPAWEKLVIDANQPYGPDGFSAYLSCVSDKAFDGLSADDLGRVGGDPPVVFAADRSSMVGDERTLIVVGRQQDTGRSFRDELVSRGRQ